MIPLRLYRASDCTLCDDVMDAFRRVNQEVELPFKDIGTREHGNRSLITKAGGYKTPVPYLKYTNPSDDVVEGLPELVNQYADRKNLRGDGEYGDRPWIDLIDQERSKEKAAAAKPIAWRDREGTIHMYESGLMIEFAQRYWAEIAADAQHARGVE